MVALPILPVLIPITGTPHMSLTGKILTLMNMMGAIGLVCLASLDYGKRQSWAHSVFLYEMVIDGLPLDETEVDNENVPIVDRYVEDTVKNLFTSVGGTEVTTQKKEVERVKGPLDSKIQGVAAQGPVPQSYLLARILLY